jgi:hypothetical protein
MASRIRLFLLVECLAFVAAALVHFGVLIDGHEHSKARIAESIIAFVLFVGLVASIWRPAMTKDAGIVAQAFALLGTLVGLFTIAIGVGPQTTLDVVYHITIIAVLIWGLWNAARIPTTNAASAT